MTIRATSTFTVDTFEPETIDEQLGRTCLTKTFTGDLNGKSVVYMLAVKTPHESGAYVAFEWIEGELQGHDGRFLLMHEATMNRGKPSGSWVIVPDSGQGALEGISGHGEIINEPGGGHTFLLDYELSGD